MAKAVYAGLIRHNCGKDLLIFASLIMALGANFGNFASEVPEQYKTKEGDIFGYIILMKNLLALKDNPNNVHNFNIAMHVNKLGIKQSLVNSLEKWLMKYEQFLNLFTSSPQLKQLYATQK